MECEVARTVSNLEIWGKKAWSPQVMAMWGGSRGSEQAGPGGGRDRILEFLTYCWEQRRLFWSFKLLCLLLPDLYKSFQVVVPVLKGQRLELLKIIVPIFRLPLPMKTQPAELWAPCSSFRLLVVEPSPWSVILLLNLHHTDAAPGGPSLSTQAMHFMDQMTSGNRIVFQSPARPWSLGAV